MRTIAVVPGDGVGKEVTDGPVEILQFLESRNIVKLTGPWAAGATAVAEHDKVLPDETIQACEDAEAIFLGAIGHHPGVDVPGFRPELALIGLREHFDLRISVRQVWQPKRPPLTFVRNLLGGAYGSAGTRVESDGTGVAQDTFELSPERIREVAHIAVDYLAHTPEGSLISVDKANLLATSRLWQSVVNEVAEERGVPVRHVLVDRFAYELGNGDLPDGVVVTEGLFGDILSDLACGRAGSIALCGSASVNPAVNSGTNKAAPSGEQDSDTQGSGGQTCAGLFEPVHGSAPSRFGQNKVNPSGGYLALATMLEWFPDTSEWAEHVRDALGFVVSTGPTTYDMADQDDPIASTTEFSAMVNRRFLESVD